ncbi:MULTISPECIES: FadR/GntR family transcriptional regulator [Rhizobium]|uniref:FadR/GntR family transcriptional regulator n=1 Tax=Rhizobium TaxID=379 RepID=UPI001441DD21|nr:MULTISPECIES: FadR/GntR family transcriptional regulator [Rhizobium]MBY2944551.1 FadR family transcriptional regulator [Rhizobium leguminosarum]MBY3031758.1 FadR family transcriptional regulator [Rhizobium leguminosarum]MBY3134415.1 FadR family transcriptional regulator [Rhizobium laguerreae]MBY3157464.1 FadR family transcriptional regulator [Rhizobium laguerreae]MBY3169982.1 FadR family transcriptional regulator [Rhizobium laguerreae]
MKDRDKAVFNMIPQTSSLRSGLAESLIAHIESGDLKPGQRLPTEQEIMEATGVSRTIVREALATLRAQGLITTRQGLGAFVSSNSVPRSFSIIPNDLESIDEVLRVLELRLGVEYEAAGLAARRRTPEDIVRMQDRLDALDQAIAAGGYGADEDFAFHRSILVATQNSYYGRLFDTFGTTMVPRQWAHLDQMTAAERQKHGERMRKEHYAIFVAIRDGNEAAARKALRNHLSRSTARFEKLRDANLKR